MRLREADLDSLLALQALYYREDGYSFDRRAARRAWRRLLDDAMLGHGWSARSGADVVGYLVLTFGYSLEYRGRDAFIDELYIAPAFRGRGLGRQALRLADQACRRLGVRALHLEVEAGKAAARALYARSGFADRRRRLMTKTFGAPSSAQDRHAS
jgi:ribosomal protein S18 acetylase RimI-like enzyme